MRIPMGKSIRKCSNRSIKKLLRRCFLLSHTVVYQLSAMYWEPEYLLEHVKSSRQ